MADVNSPAQPQAPGTNAQAGTPDLYRAYQFKLLIDGVNKGHFMRCTGMGIRVTPIAYREGGDLQVVRQLVGPVHHSEVTLSYGLIKADSEAIWQWLMTGVGGRAAPKNVSIVLLGTDGSTEMVRYNLNAAWPTVWRGAELDALSREIAIEHITLVHEALTRA